MPFAGAVRRAAREESFVAIVGAAIALVLTHDVLKIFTALYVLTGIGILVEVARQLGVGP